MKHTLINKNVLEALNEIPDESIDCIVTSPPYYGLRSFKGAGTDWGDWKGQLGLEPSYQMYLDHLMLVTEELKRVLKKTGTMFWNMGDTYNNNPSNQGVNTGNREALEQLGRMKREEKSIAAKSLMLITERFATRMVDDGWILRNKLIWYKRNAMPSSVKDRFANKYEFVYFFSKASKYYFDLDSVRKPLTEMSIKRPSEKNLDNQFQTGKVAEMGKFSRTGDMKKALVNLRNKSFNIQVRDAKKGIMEEKWGNLYSASEEEIKNYDEKKYHGNIPKDASEKAGSPRARQLRNFFNEKGQGGNFDFNGINSADGTHYDENGANPGDVLDVPTMPHKFAHFAIFPETLVEPLIKAGCPEDGVVLDPFAGSGTTGTVARRLGRSSIMIEISSEYCKIIKERMQWGSGFDIEWAMNSPIEEVMVG